MIRFAPIIALVFLATPAIAAPKGHQQPTPATVQQPGADPASFADKDVKPVSAQVEQNRAKTQKELDERQKMQDAKWKRTMGSICNGC